MPCEALAKQGAGHIRARAREKLLKSGQGRKWLDKLEARTWLARGE